MLVYLIILAIVIFIEIKLYIRLQKGLLKRKVVRIAQQCALMDINKQLQDTLFRDFGPLSPEEQNLPTVQKVMHEAIVEINKNSKSFEDLQRKIDLIDTIIKFTHINLLDSILLEDMAEKGI